MAAPPQQVPSTITTPTITPAQTTTNTAASSTSQVQATNPTVHQTIIYSSHKLPALATFHGKTQDKGTTAKQWIRQFEQAASNQGWDDQKKMNGLSIYLKDNAYTWFDELSQANKNDWVTLMQAFIAEFGQVHDKIRAEIEFTGRRQNSSESAEEFAEDLKRLGKEMEATSDTIRSKFIFGLQPKIRSRVLEQGCETLEEARKLANRFETIYGKAIPEVNAIESSSLHNEVKTNQKQIADLNAKIDRVLNLKHNPSQSRSNFSRDQQSRSICGFCQKPGHNENSCYSKFPHLRNSNRSCFRCGGNHATKFCRTYQPSFNFRPRTPNFAGARRMPMFRPQGPRQQAHYIPQRAPYVRAINTTGQPWASQPEQHQTTPYDHQQFEQYPLTQVYHDGNHMMNPNATNFYPSEN